MLKVKTLPPRPTPKQQHRPEMSDAEAGELLRQLVHLEQDIQKHYASIAEKKRKKDALLHQANLGFGGGASGIIEVCGLCGLAHERGSC